MRHSPIVLFSNNNEEASLGNSRADRVSNPRSPLFFVAQSQRLSDKTQHHLHTDQRLDLPEVFVCPACRTCNKVKAKALSL